MSSLATSAIKNAFTNTIVQQTQSKTNLNTSYMQDLDNISLALQKIANAAPKPFTFIQSNNNCLLSNESDGTMIIQSPIMSHGQLGVVEDLNINFTTVAGTVRVVKVNSSGTILVDILRGINASSSGTGSTVLGEGEAIAIVGQSAGAGIFGVFFSGKIYNTGI